MTLTTTERITVDGVDMKTLAKNITTLGATLRRAAWRGANAPTAGREGSLWTPLKQRDEVVYNWPVWVVGTDDDGLIPGGSTARREFFTRVDELIALFSKRDSLLDVRHTLPDSTVRQAFLECRDLVDFTTRGINPLGRVNLALANPDGAAQDISDVNQNVLTGSSLPNLLGFSSWVGATEIMDDLVITITGPITNPELEAYRGSNPLPTRVWMRYNGAITASQTLVVNTTTGAVTGTGGLSPLLSNMVWAGSPRFFRLVPNTGLAVAPQVRVSGSGATAATAVRIVGRRKYGTW